MKNQQGKILIIALIIIGVIMSLSIYVLMKRNSFVVSENQIEAIHADMKNVHASIFQQMKQQGVAVDKYGDMVIEALQSTFGEGGSKAAFQWLQNQGTIPPSIMEKLQVTIEAGYNKFEAAQRTKIDIVRVYKNDIKLFPGSLVASTLGYPTKTWAELEFIVISAETKVDFKTGEFSDPKIFNDN